MVGDVVQVLYKGVGMDIDVGDEVELVLKEVGQHHFQWIWRVIWMVVGLKATYHIPRFPLVPIPNTPPHQMALAEVTMAIMVHKMTQLVLATRYNQNHTQLQGAWLHLCLQRVLGVLRVALVLAVQFMCPYLTGQERYDQFSQAIKI